MKKIYFKDDLNKFDRTVAWFGKDNEEVIGLNELNKATSQFEEGTTKE